MIAARTVAERLMPASRTPLPLHPLVLFGVALLGGTLVWQPGLAARGGQQPPSAERQRVERLSQRAMDRVRALQTEADELASRERTLLGEIRRLEIDRQIRTEELGVIDGDLAETTGQLEDTATRISDLEREADAQRPLVEARLVALYKMGTPRYTRLLLGAGDLRARGRNYRLIGSLARRDREQFDDLRETVTDLQVSRSTLEARQVEVAALQEAARAARRALDRTIASQTALVEEIDTRRDLTAQLAGELEAAREQLEAPLAELAAGGSPGATTLALPLRPFRGQIEPPVPGEVTVPFGAPRPTEFGTTIAGGGIELAATPGESVYAIHEGEVVSVGTFEGLGTLVIVSHGDQAFSLYGYLASLAVHKGGQVDERAELGTAGVSPTGDATVYFELRIDGRPVDPVEWLKQ
ncbi:MAG TPA: hypothetical protein EYM36_02520 [Acidobacteria bacterium]|nr:hypothetical protein [Acidobacteriota bacterium]